MARAVKNDGDDSIFKSFKEKIKNLEGDELKQYLNRTIEKNPTYKDVLINLAKKTTSKSEWEKLYPEGFQILPDDPKYKYEGDIFQEPYNPSDPKWKVSPDDIQYLKEND